MGNLLAKLLTQEETTKTKSSNKNMERLKLLAHEFLGINGREFEALYSCISKEMKEARDQDLARALHSMQEKLDQESKKTPTRLQLWNVLNRMEKVSKDLEARKSHLSSEEMQQIEAVKEDIRKLKEGEQTLTHQMKLREMAEGESAKQYVKKTADALNSELHRTTKQNHDMGEVRALQKEVISFNDEAREAMKQMEIRILQEKVKSVTGKMEQVKSVNDKMEHKLGDAETALKSLGDGLKDVAEELKSVKDAATNREEKVVPCELGNVKEELIAVREELRLVQEELRVVKEKTRDAKDEQRELTEGGLRNVVTDANVTTESIGKEASAQADRLTQQLTELKASTQEMGEMIKCNMKRSRDSRFPTCEPNKKVRKQSPCAGEHGLASCSRRPVYSNSTTSSSESDSSSPPCLPKSYLNSSSDSDSDSDSSESDSSSSPFPPRSNLNRNFDSDSNSSDSDSNSGF